MGDARDAVREKVRTRVRVTTDAGDTLEGILAALTPADDLLVADPRGHETRVPFRDVKAVDDARYTCAECGKQMNVNHDGDLCADCYRAWAMKQPAPSETCEVCQQPGAVYSPKYKFWRCCQCHAKEGSFSGSTVEARVLTAPCRSDDKDSLRHDWKRVKSQWVCKLCQVKVLGMPAGAKPVL